MGDIAQDSNAVDAFQFYRCVEEQLLVHVPFRVEYAVAETSLEFCRNGARTFVNLDMVHAVDEAEGVIAGDGVAASREDELTDVLVSDIDGLLAVEAFFDGEIVSCNILRFND